MLRVDFVYVPISPFIYLSVSPFFYLSYSLFFSQPSSYPCYTQKWYNPYSKYWAHTVFGRNAPFFYMEQYGISAMPTLFHFILYDSCLLLLDMSCQLWCFILLCNKTVMNLNLKFCIACFVVDVLFNYRGVQWRHTFSWKGAM